MDSDPDTDPSIDKQKKLKKNLVSTNLRLLFDFLSMKTDINVPSRSNKQINFEEPYFLLAPYQPLAKKAGCRPNPDLDPDQNTTDL